MPVPVPQYQYKSLKLGAVCLHLPVSGLVWTSIPDTNSVCLFSLADWFSQTRQYNSQTLPKTGRNRTLHLFGQSKSVAHALLKKLHILCQRGGGGGVGEGGGGTRRKGNDFSMCDCATSLAWVGWLSLFCYLAGSHQLSSCCSSSKC